ncbi:hypothetical protein VWM38_26935, partial [Escherichia coli O157]|nr:hypothetical protein [Escherichia coli O157]
MPNLCIQHNAGCLPVNSVPAPESAITPYTW